MGRADVRVFPVRAVVIHVADDAAVEGRRREVGRDRTRCVISAVITLPAMPQPLVSPLQWLNCQLAAAAAVKTVLAPDAYQPSAAVTLPLPLVPVVSWYSVSHDQVSVGVVGQRQRDVGRAHLGVIVADDRAGRADDLRADAGRNRRVRDVLRKRRAMIGRLRARIGAAVGANDGQRVRRGRALVSYAPISTWAPMMRFDPSRSTDVVTSRSSPALTQGDDPSRR